MKKLRWDLGLYLSYVFIFTLLAVAGKISVWVAFQTTEVASISTMLNILFWGLKFDLSIAALFALFAFIAHDVFRKKIKIVSLVLFALLTAQVIAISSDLMYFKHVGRHIIYEYKTLFENFGDLILTGLGEHTFSFLAMMMLIPFGFFASQVIVTKFDITFMKARGKIFTQVVSYFLVLVLGVILFRGGPTGTALKPQHFYKAKDSRYAVLGWNPLYYMFHAMFFKAKYQYPQISTDQESIALWKKYFESRPKKEIVPTKKYNVVFVLLESWTGEYSIPSEFTQEITPHFNELSKKSLTTLATVAGGQRTTEGIFSIFCSFQNPLGLAIPDGNLNFLDYSCLPEFLKQNGWDSFFLQGTRNETSNVGPFAQKVGFESSQGKHSYNAKTYPENSWGYYDQDIYEYALQKMDEMKEPFILGINTNTTHSNQLPPGEEFKFGNATPEEVYKSVLHFSDRALGEFIKKVESKKYFKNTIFVLLPDHGGFAVRPHPAHRFLIPGMIYAPEILKAQKLNLVSTQRDFAPTVLDLMGGYLPSLAGDSLLKSQRSVPPSEFYSNSKLVAVSDKKIVSYDLSGANETCFDFTFPEFQSIPCSESDIQMANEAKAFTRMSQSLLLHGKTKELLKFDTLFHSQKQ